MAKQVIETLVDDIDGSEADHALEFAVDGVTFEIDLSETHYQEFQGAIDKFRQAARKASGRAPARQAPRKARPAAAPGANLTEIREWAKANGHQVSDRGRISKVVQDAYAAAH